MQPKLLRAIEAGEFRRVGGSKSISVDMRVVAATNRHIESRLADGSFRTDLYYRLAQVRIHLPPLRERVDDISLLVEAFLERLRQQEPRRPIPRFSQPAIEALQRYAWPGNVRELRNVVERIVSLCERAVVSAEFVRGELAQQQNLLRTTATMPKVVAHSDTQEELFASFFEADESLRPLKESKELLIDAFEQRYLLRLFEKHQSNLSAAAREAGIDRRHLYRLMKKHGIAREE
ncbi:MAG: sigma 54-interacting transcriptional regulator, partial [Myxococcota bacterium]|jgi:DNA-binding NtrC family response regulator|nr:sigma 54-interacting transcriptional regulator [Myxococcota bacterium]